MDRFRRLESVAGAFAEAPLQKRIKLGQLLVGAGVLSEAQLDVALAEQKKLRLKLGRTLIELGFLTEERLLETLAEQLEIPLIDLAEREIDPEVVVRLPETHARRHRAILLDAGENGFLVGLADPTDLLAADELALVLRGPVRRAIVRESDLLRVLDLAYRRTEEISNLAAELRAELAEAEPLIDVDQLSEETQSAPVVKLLSTLFEEAIRLSASDIHIEPDEQVLRIRQRVDGILQEHVMDEKAIVPALVQRLKLMSGLDISEKRMPQDGRFHAKVTGREIDVRLSTMPIQYGESVVMRLLDQSSGIANLDRLGMPDPVLHRIRSVLRSPHGMLLVTGPTGSGKTTTLYASLAEVNTPEHKIITVEDPVEYRLERVNQVQVKAKIGLDFARVLRAALRQDPDVVMVGEIRDEETAQIALRAAMTGHLVLSTVHTNDSISTAMRLVDMGAPGYLVASAVRAVIAQRLIRRVCKRCAEPHRSADDEQAFSAYAAWMGQPVGEIKGTIGQGCTHCHETGYRGRVGVYEFLEVDTAMSDALRRDDTAGYLRAARAQPQFYSLRRSVGEAVANGVTSIPEALRILGDLELSTGDTPDGVGDGAL